MQTWSKLGVNCVNRVNLEQSLLKVYMCLPPDEYDTADGMRNVWQKEVFGPTVEDLVLQKHLNLQPGQQMQSL